MSIILQRIVTHWSKLSRGAPLSAERNAVPERIVLNGIDTDGDYGVLMHDVKAHESESFQLHENQSKYPLKDHGQFKLKPITLSLSESVLEIDYFYDYWEVGAPRREPIKKTIISLRPDQWGQIRLNGRLGHELGWVYHKKVYNIALIDASTKAADSSYFAGTPDVCFDDMADLW